MSAEEIITKLARKVKPDMYNEAQKRKKHENELRDWETRFKSASSEVTWHGPWCPKSCALCRSESQ